MASKRVCITGAAGNLGSLTAGYFLENTDYELVLMTHQKDLPAGLNDSSRVKERRCDLERKETLLSALEGVDEIIHYAGVLFKPNPRDFLPRTNTQYFANLLEIARQCEVKRIILISFPHVEGETGVEVPSTDRLDQIPVSAHATTRLEEERLLYEFYPEGIVLRVGMVYGRGILMPDGARWLARRWLLGVWKSPTTIHLISRPDFLEAVRMASVNEETLGTYNIGDEGVQSLQEYLDFACEQWKCRKPWRMPLWLIYGAAFCCEMIAKILGTKSPLTGDFIDIGRVSYYGDTRRMKEDLISELKYPTMRDGAEIF